MRQINWEAHKAHRQQVITDSTITTGGQVTAGCWLGLLDEDFVPIVDLPQVTKMDWPDIRGSIDSVEITLRVRTPSGGTHRVVSELVANNLGKVDAVGKLVPVSGPVRLVEMRQGEGEQRTMLVTHAKAEGDADSPHTLTIYGVSALGYLDLLPCPSNPLSWTGEFTRFERDWVGPEDAKALFVSPRDLAPCTMITVADGASVEGKADEVIYRLIKESLEAVHRVRGIVEDPFYVAILDESRGAAEQMIHRPTDQTIWQEIGERALTAGVSVRAHLWWPGDNPIPGYDLNLPTMVFRIRQEA